MLILLSMLICGNLSAKKKKSKEKTKFTVDFGFHVGNASSYYAVNGNLISEMKRDSAYSFQNYGDSLTNMRTTYIYDMKYYTFDLQFKYDFTDNLSVYLKLPYSMYNYVESDLLEYTDSTKSGGGTYNRTKESARFTVADLSLSQFDYYGIGFNYVITNTEYYSEVNFEYRLPPGSHKGVFDDPGYKMLSDGANEFLAGFKVGYISPNTNLSANVRYNYRDEEFVDQLIVNTVFGFSKVEDTELRVKLDYISSLSGFDNVRFLFPPKGSSSQEVYLNLRQSVVQEDYLSIGIAFWAEFFNNIENEFSYSVRLFGTNTRNQGIFSVVTSFKF